MAAGPAECEDAFPIDCKYLAAHHMNHGRPDFMHLAAMPFLHGVGIEPVKVFMIPVHEQGGKGLALQPVHQMLLFLIFPSPIPDPAEISADNDVIILCHLFLLRKYPGVESPEVLVAVAGNVNHFHHFLSDVRVSTVCEAWTAVQKIARREKARLTVQDCRQCPYSLAPSR